MTSARLRRIVSRSAIALALAIGIGGTTVPPANAEWRNGTWGHWGWQGGVHVFIAEPYPYPYYAPPPVYYAPPPVVYAPPPPIVYAPPVLAPSFGIFIGGRH